jgi:3-carboxy-cis,cis-muconate cycloisomerase
LAHSILQGLVGDREIAEHFTGEAEVAAILDFEVALARGEAAENVIGDAAASAIAAVAEGFEPDFALLEAGTMRDGVVVPALLEQLRARLPAQHRPALHFGATSQDAIDTGLALRLKKVSAILDGRMESVLAALDRLEQRDGGIEVMAHTRMQAAIAVPASRKIASWTDPLGRARQRLGTAADGVTLVCFGGAAGTMEKLGEHGPAVLHRLARLLELEAPTRARHSERDGMAEFASALSILTGALGKLGQDVALMAQTEICEIKLASGGGSSAMPHKVNPVGAETLVALARLNATLVSAMHHSLVHENERSGAAWTLEWMVLPQMAVAAGAALRTAADLVAGLSFVRR